MSGIFRELTEEEALLVAGGIQYEQSIDVVGRRYLMSREDYYGDPEDSDPQRSDFGDEGRWVRPFSEWLSYTCDVDFGVDWIAQQVAQEIKAKSDWAAREYATVIYWTPEGDIKSLPLTRGMTVAEATAAGLGAPETRISLPSWFVSQGMEILAVIHNHPDIGYSSQQDLQNRYPSYYQNSNGTAGGDYGTFQSLVALTDAGTNYRFTNGAVFAQYILGPDGVLREFNWNLGVKSYATDTAQERADRSNLAKDRPCWDGPNP